MRFRLPHLIVLALAVALIIGGVFRAPAGSRAATLRVASAHNLTARAAGGQSVAFDLNDLAPGDSGSGTIDLHAADDRATWEIDPAAAVDAPGQFGGLLSHVIQLRVASGDTVLYSGPLSDFQDTVTLPAGAARTVRFDVSWPDGGEPPTPTTGDNAYQGAALTVDYAFRAAVPDPTSSPTPAAVTPPASGVEGAITSGTTRCASRRRFTIRLRIPRGIKVYAAKVTVAGKRVKVKHGKRWTAVVDLRGAKSKTVRVNIELRGFHGKVVKGRRTYRTCAATERGTHPTL